MENTSDNNQDTNQQIEQLRNQAKIAAAQANFEQALSYLQQASQLDNNNYLIHLDLVQMYLQQGLLSQAIRLFEKLPEQAQTSAEGVYLAGFIQFAEIMQQSADIQTLQQQLQQNPNNSQALYSFASFLVVHQEFEKAMQTLFKLFQVERDFKDNAAQKLLIVLFEMLAGQQPGLVKQYRRLLQNLLY